MQRLLKIATLVTLFTIVCVSAMPKIGNGKIIGGESATDGEFPYHIIIWSNSTAGNHSRDPDCGGALVSVNGYQFVLTTVVCGGRNNPRTANFYAGITNRDQTNGHVQRRGLTKFIPHEGYHYSSNVHDIAILVLDAPFEINEFVAPIPLPTQGQPTTGDVIGTGFGVTNDQDFDGSRVLQKITLPVVSDDVCRERYPLERISPYMMCAGRLGESDRDFCYGDAGDPLKAVDGGYLAGIASFGFIECGHPEYPSVNTEIAFYIDWIKFQLENNVPK